MTKIIDKAGMDEYTICHKHQIQKQSLSTTRNNNIKLYLSCAHNVTSNIKNEKTNTQNK